jgi:hypothetical protein
MPEDARYFEVCDHVGLNPDGSLEPAAEIGLGVQVTRVQAVPDPDNPAREMVVEVVRPERVALQPIPGTRIYKVTDQKLGKTSISGQVIADALVEHCVNNNILREIDAPHQKDLRKAREETADARESAGTHTEPGENATIDNDPEA